MKKPGFVVLLFLFALAISSAQNSVAVSGTVFARAGSNLQNTFIIACFIVNDECDEQGSKITQLDSSANSAKYSLAGLTQNREYLIFAWRDLNNNQEPDNGDELGVSQRDGKPLEIKAPASGVDLRLVLFNGDFEALLNQANQQTQPSAPSTGQRQPSSPTDLSLSGHLRPLAGSSLNDAIVLASVWENGQYNQNRSKGVRPDSSGKFSLTNLEKTSYVLFAWRDLDNNGDVNAADEVAPYRVNNKLSLVTPTVQNIVLQFEKGDSSLDQLVALTMNPSATQPNPVSSNPTTNSPSSGSNVKDPCPTIPRIPAQKPEPGWFKGIAIDRCGKRIANVEVSVNEPVSFGSSLKTRTDKNGEYRIRVANRSYEVYAEFNRQYQGQNYKFCLEPDTAETQNGVDGGVVNLVFHAGRSLTALPGENKGFGGSITLSTFSVFARGGVLPSGSKVTITIVPLGVMADGYPKPTFTRSFISQGSSEIISIEGLPFGKLRISVDAKLPNGQTFWYPIRLRSDPYDSNGARSVEISTLPARGDNISCFGRYNADATVDLFLTVTK